MAGTPVDRTLRTTPVWLAGGFRPFFLAMGAFAVVQMLGWLAVYSGGASAPGPFAPAVWHAHEMLFGWAAAAVAGFLTTAVPVWTGTGPVAGAPLAALVALWLAARAAIVAGTALPPAVAAALDAAFLLALAGVVGRRIAGARQRRNALFPLAIVGLALADVLVHVGGAGTRPALAAAGLRLGVGLLVLLVSVVAGRIAPAFTRGALQQRGETVAVETPARLERAVVPAVLLAVAADVLLPRTAWSGAAAALAAVVLGARMARWRTARTLDDPLLWSLHLAHGWAALGFAALALSDLAGVLPWTGAVHALTAGALGAAVIAVSTRVGLGHTGRPLTVPRAVPWAYALVSAAALVRVATPLAPRFYGDVILLAGLAWVAAWTIFVVVYAPILTRPRVDGRPG